MNPGPDPDFAYLLRDGAWLRSFVRTLVPARDVDDLVQSTWLAALQQPAVMHRPSLWLRGAARNLARMLHRQQLRTRRRESISRATEPVPSAADLVAGLEVQRFVSDALLALPEPTRSILVLRYHEDLEPAAIAARLGLQPAAVRQRLHRGRQLVRARFEQRFGRDWRGGAAVLAFVGPDSGSGAGSGVAAGAAFAVVTAIAACACVAWLANGSSIAGSGVEPLTAAFAPVAADSADRSPRARADAAVERSLVASLAQDPAPAVPAPTIELRGRIVAAEDGQPLAGVRLTTDLGWRSTTPKQERIAPSLTTSADGRFAIVVPPAAVNVHLWLAFEGRCPRWYYTTQPKAVELGDVPMARGYVVRAQLVDEVGLPMQGVRIQTRLEGEFPDPGAMGFPSTTDAHGSFACCVPVPAGPLEFQSGQPGVELLEPTVDIVPNAAPIFVRLRGRRLPSIRGVVFGADGMPCKGVSLQAQAPPYRSFSDVSGEGTSASDGSFEIFRTRGEALQVAILPPPLAAHELAAAPALHAWGAAGVRVEVRALVPVRLRVFEADTRKPVERFGLLATRWIGEMEHSTGGTNLEFHEAGIHTFAGLAGGTRILVWSGDADLAPAALFVDEVMAGMPTVDVPLARLQPFALTLVDANGQPVASEVHVLDRVRAEQPRPWTDLRTGPWQTGGHSPLHLSVATTDATGAATLLAPTDRRDLVVAVRRGERDVWLPLALPAPGQPVRLTLPQ